MYLNFFKWDRKSNREKSSFLLYELKRKVVCVTMMWEKDIETMSRKDLESLQLERLKNVVSRCYRQVPYYHKKLDEAGINPDKIKTLSDVQYLPFTTKADIRDTYPYGLFAVPMRDIVRIHASSGTTGKPTVVGYTRNDLEVWSNLIARLTTAAGATAEDIVQISFGYGLFTGALGLHYGLEKIGASVIPISSGNHRKAADGHEGFWRHRSGGHSYLRHVYGRKRQGTGL